MAKDVVYEVFLPSLSMYDSRKIPVFTARETVKNIITNDLDKISTILTIDFFYTEGIDKTDPHELDRLEMDLNLPFGAGCSQFIAPTRPQAPSSESFMMTFSQNSLQSVILLAYDHKSNYLRKEIVGQSVGVWDLNEDLFYHVDLKPAGRLTNDVDIDVAVDECSVISVETKQQFDRNEAWSGSILKPYKDGASSLDVLDFLGATSVHYVGLATVRDIPCLVYESIVSEAPKVFNLDLRVDLAPNLRSIDYIVQYYIFKTAKVQYNQPATPKGEKQNESVDNRAPESLVPLIGDQFWPARIILLKRDKLTGRTRVYDRLEVSDFHWGLFGWLTKPSELFMLPECFTDDDEQVRLNFELDFGEQLQNSEDNQIMLRHNKYKLEKDLIRDLFGAFKMSLLHLTEFNLALRAHSVLANLIIADRIEDKLLSYYGEGELPEATSYINNRIRLQELDKPDHGGESSCLLKAVHIADVSMVIYCPRQSDVEGPTCEAIFGESQPVIKRPWSSSKSKKPEPIEDSQPSYDDPFVEPKACRVYRLEPREPPKAVTNNVDQIAKALKDLRFKFEMTKRQRGEPMSSDITKPKVTLTGIIRDFDVSHETQLISVDNYKYALELKHEPGSGGDPAGGEKPLTKVGKVRAFDTIIYNNLGDCLKMCNLDASCKSYSYCNNDEQYYGKCILSSLDIRVNNIEQQLVTSKSQGKQVVVRDLEAKDKGNNEYWLELNSACNIYERDSLSMFVESDELVSIHESLQSSYMTTTSVTECAHEIVAQEEAQPNYHSSMFAYCPSTGSCLIDERLFGSIKIGSDDEDKEEPTEGQQEILCHVYRKQYQTYFHVSPLVLKRVPHKEGEGGSGGGAEHESTKLVKQTDLEFNTVEECAHACWNSFGHACISFDFCLPKDCIINLIDADASGSKSAKDIAATLDYESRSGCLHYERDLALDELRRTNLIGHHKPLDLPQKVPDVQEVNETKASSPGFFLTAISYIATAVLFVVGLAIGHKLNERLEMGPRRRGDSSSMGPNSSGGVTSRKSTNFRVSFASFVRRASARRGSTSSQAKFDIDNDICEELGGAIPLEEFGQRNDVATDELTTSKRNQADPDARETSSPTSSANTYQSVESKSNHYEELPDTSPANNVEVSNILAIK